MFCELDVLLDVSNTLSLICICIYNQPLYTLSLIFVISVSWKVFLHFTQEEIEAWES